MNDDPEEIDESTFWERYRVLIFLIVFVLIAGAVAFSALLLSGRPSRSKPPEQIAIHLLPPPLPPPPPPPQPPPPKLPPPPEQKMVEQPPVKPNEVKPKLENKAPDKPPGPPGPAASGPPSDFGIGGNGAGGDGIGGGGGGGSRFGYYANEVVTKISEAIRQNEKTRDALAHVKVRLWLDANGRIIRSKLAASSDDPAVDAALQNDVLAGLTIPEPPPSDMPMPIVLLLSETRPN